MTHRFLIAAGGTGGHVIPALVVARELRRRGHEVIFVGAGQGLEEKLVPKEGFQLFRLPIGALKRVGWRRRVRTLVALPGAVIRALVLIHKVRPGALFSVGGYAAGPAMLAAWLAGVPIVILEPNAVAGFTNRQMGRAARKVLLQFGEAARFFPSDRVEVVGVPVRPEFFAVPPVRRAAELVILVTGGSQGSRTLNRAACESWPLFKRSGLELRWIHQSGLTDYAWVRDEFARSGFRGEVVPFMENMAQAYAEAHLVVCRAGAGTIAELAAAGRPAILVPFPYAADDHQRHNAEALVRVGAARLVLDHEMTGQRLHDEVLALASEVGRLEQMAECARKFARPDAARRAADVLESMVGQRK